jgi:hypothetical protein
MGIFLAGSLIQTIILINNDNYAFPAYQGSLLAIAVVLICCGSSHISSLRPEYDLY